jgi:hypothetical protein
MSMEAVAVAAGLTRLTVYKQFGSGRLMEIFCAFWASEPAVGRLQSSHFSKTALNGRRKWSAAQ